MTAPAPTSALTGLERLLVQRLAADALVLTESNGYASNFRELAFGLRSLAQLASDYFGLPPEVVAGDAADAAVLGEAA